MKLAIWVFNLCFTSILPHTTSMVIQKGESMITYVTQHCACANNGVYFCVGHTVSQAVLHTPAVIQGTSIKDPIYKES